MPVADAWTERKQEHNDRGDSSRQVVRPILPGPDYDFKSAKPERFHRGHTLQFKNGLRVQRRPTTGIGGQRLVQDMMVREVGDQPAFDGAKDAEPPDRVNSQLNYGKSRPKSAPAFRPRYCFTDKKVLRFFAHFEEMTGQDFEPEVRIRHVQLLYFLEDDTISIIEPKIKNSGLYQGLLLKRHRVPLREPILGERAFWHWTDLRVGETIELYGREYHLRTCDDFTRRYLLSEGIDLETEDKGNPQNVVVASRQMDKEDVGIGESSVEVATPRPKKEGKLKKFLENDGKVLRFYCLSDLPKYALGARGSKAFVIHFYLGDDSLEVRELREADEGKIVVREEGIVTNDNLRHRSGVPSAAGAKYLKRQRLPKTKCSFGSEDFPSNRQLGPRDFFSADDFAVGEIVKIQNREFLIYDCDEFTARYLGIKRDANANVNEEGGGDGSSRRPPDKTAERIAREEAGNRIAMVAVPPHTKDCIGDPQDSVQSCLRLMPKAPKKDLRKFIDYSGKTLRFSAEFVTPWPWQTDRSRRLVLTYFLADDTIDVHEMLPDNSGLLTGKFLSRRRVAKPKPKVNGEVDFYTLEDIYIGSVLLVYGRQLRITGADRRVLRYLDHDDHRRVPIMPKHCELSIRNYFYKAGTEKEDFAPIGQDSAREGEEEEEVK